LSWRLASRATAVRCPGAAVDYLAKQVNVDPSLFDEYAWSGRTIEYHRAQIRAALGFHEPTVEDEDNLAVWLAEDVCPVELSEDRLREALLAMCRAERMEPPAPGRGERILGAARSAFERQFTAGITGRLSAPAMERLEQLVLEESSVVAVGGGGGFLAELKADPAPKATRCNPMRYITLDSVAAVAEVVLLERRTSWTRDRNGQPV
jgi:hypothetical protein